MTPGEEFVSEELHPVAGTGDASAMSRGEPGIPGRFHWRDQEYTLAQVFRTWKTTAHEGGRPSGEVYLRRHWFEILTTSGLRMVVYCERQARPGRPKARWWVYTIHAGNAQG